jgi:hypothetical protein
MSLVTMCELLLQFIQSQFKPAFTCRMSFTRDFYALAI